MRFNVLKSTLDLKETPASLLKTALFGLCIFSVHFTLMASEIDSFTHRFSPLPDITQKLNTVINLKLINAIGEANKKSACSEITLYDEIQTELVGPFGVFFFSNIENFIEESPSLEKQSVKRKDSVYQEFNFFDSPPIHLANLGSVIKLKNQRVGTDKIGHFFAIGYHYFQLAHLKRRGFQAALLAGEEQEGGIMGLKATGIWSYADLVANYQGMVFWTRLLEKYPYPPLPQNEFSPSSPGPYVLCENDQWVLNKSFDWREYVDESWDEAINCNKFANKKLEDLAVSRIKKLETEYGQSLACPLSEMVCFDLVEKYQNLDLAKRLLHPQCLKAHPGTFDYP